MSDVNKDTAQTASCNAVAEPRRWRNGRLAEVARLGEMHKRLADVLLTELPIPTEEQLAQRFGYSRSHISRIICSQVFQEYLSEQRDRKMHEMVRLRFEADRAQQLGREQRWQVRKVVRGAARERTRTEESRA